MKLNTNISFQFSDKDNLVYFIVDIKELFDVSLSYPGIRTSLRKAFNNSKKFIPVDTGLMMLRRLNLLQLLQSME